MDIGIEPCFTHGRDRTGYGSCRPVFHTVNGERNGNFVIHRTQLYFYIEMTIRDPIHWMTFRSAWKPRFRRIRQVDG